MAVYTDVSDDDLAAFLEGYDIGAPLSCKGIAEGVENSNFLLRTSAGHYILTLYEKRVDVNDLPFFVGLMEHLATRGIVCPQPVRNKLGESLGALAGRPAAIVTFLEGMWPKRPDARQCGMFEAARTRADEVLPGLAPIIAGELAHLRTCWPKGLPSGVVHADLFPDNVFFLSGKLSGVIDFYFACDDAFAYDLAICLNAWCFEPDASFNLTKGMALLSGYEGARALDDAEAAALPTLARGAALRFLLTRLVDWLDRPEGALVKPKDPIEYLKKLRFHQHVAGAREYGLSR